MCKEKEKPDTCCLKLAASLEFLGFSSKRKKGTSSQNNDSQSVSRRPAMFMSPKSLSNAVS